MNASRSTTIQLLSWDLNRALLSNRLGASVITPPEEGSTDYELQFEEYIKNLKEIQNNLTLRAHYNLTKHIIDYDQEFNYSKISHRVGSFLYSYFQNEPDAISHLRNTSISMIEKLTKIEWTFLIAKRIQSDSSDFDQALADFWTDDVWYDSVDVRDPEGRDCTGKRPLEEPDSPRP